MTWEERMAAKATVRHKAQVAINDAKRLQERQPTQTDEQVITEYASKLTNQEAEQSFNSNHACGCMGGPLGCKLCYCHLNMEAAAKVLGVPCRWNECPRTS